MKIENYFVCKKTVLGVLGWMVWPFPAHDDGNHDGDDGDDDGDDDVDDDGDDDGDDVDSVR